MALSSGVYRLIGVGVGAFATSGFQLALATRAERRTELAARRNVSSELREIYVAIELVLEEDRLADSARKVMSETPMWARHRDALGQSQGTPWDLLEDAYAHVPDVLGQCEAATRRKLNAAEIDSMRRMQRRLTYARDVLNRPMLRRATRLWWIDGVIRMIRHLPPDDEPRDEPPVISH